MAYDLTGAQTEDKPVIIWAHGWGQSHASFKPLIQSLESRGRHVALDLPGFGQSPAPDEDWGTQDYANYIAAFIKANNWNSVIWVGHSFGCRVGLQMAAHNPHLIKGLCLIAGAGLKRKRPIHKRLYFFLRIRLFKLLRHFLPEGRIKSKIMAAFGSSDYKSAGAMRKIFVRVVNEDLTPQAMAVTCPTALVYGTKDNETPPEFGERFSKMIKGARLHLLDEQDHYSVLQDGRHPVIKILNDFIGKTCT